MKIAIIGDVRDYSRKSISVWVGEVGEGLEKICGAGIEALVPRKINSQKVIYQDYSSEFEAIENADYVVIFGDQKKYLEHMDYIKNNKIICAIVSSSR